MSKSFTEAAQVPVPLRLLHIEDDATDGGLILRVLKKAGYGISSQRIEDEEGMRSALAQSAWDLVISDYSLPSFSAMRALEVLQESGLDLPFIVASGTIGEDVAVQMMKAGAHDYVMKGNLARLAPAVERELHDARIRWERRESEQALRSSEAKLTCVVESALDAVVMTDSQGKVTLWNPAAERMFGFRRDEALGQFLHCLIMPPGMEEAAVRGMEAFRRTGQGAFMGRLVELSALRKDRTEVPVELSIAPVQIDGTWHAVGVVRDISERKSSQKALGESEKRWQFALEGAGDGVWDWNLETNEVFYSRQWKSMLGYDESEVGTTVDEWRDRVHPDDLERALADVQDHLDGRSPVYFSEHRMRCKDGSYKWILDRGTIISRALDGSPLRMIGTHADVTDRKEAEERNAKLQAQFLQAQKMESIGRLAGGVAHDLNNLLTVINGYSDLVLATVGETGPIGGSVQEVRRAGERATGLVRQLLAFSRKQLLRPELVNINTVITEVDKLLARLIGEDVEIVMDLRPLHHSVRADRHQIEQVLLNLVVNARDAMPDGGVLTIETREVWREGSCGICHVEIRPGLYVEISVRDTGIGMDADTQQHLFEPFFTTKPIGKGTGLGLATVQGIVLQSGGHIDFDSAPQQGTTFRVYLPAVAPEAAEKSLSAPVVEGGTETIILAEDQEDVRRLVHVILETQGYKVLVAQTGEEALQYLANHRADLLLTDVAMPKMSGRDLARRARDAQPDLRILFMSGHSPEMVSAVEACGDMVDFIQKPFSPEGLAVKVRAMFGPGD